MKRVIHAVILSCVCATAALAQSTDTKNGIAAFNGRNYAMAVHYLEKSTRTADFSNTIAHYYLANAYLQTNRAADAKREFAYTLQLDPNGSAAALCRSALSSMSAYTSSAPSDYRAKAATKQQQSPAATTAKVPFIDEQAIRAKMPRIPTFRAESPKHSEIVGWNDTDKANFYFQAKDRLAHAQTRKQDADALLKRAESVAYSVVPSTRAYGESEVDQRSRVEQGRAKIEPLMTPYRLEVEAADKGIVDAQNLIELCISAARTIRSINGVPY